MNLQASTDPGNPARVLIMRGGAIGDFVVTLPALTAVRQQWPRAHIELAGYPHVAQLGVVGGSLINKVLSLDGADFAPLFANDPPLSPTLTARLQAYDLIISYLNDPGGPLRTNLQRAGVRRLVCGSPLVTGTHAIDVFLKPLEELGIRRPPNEYSRLYLSGQRVEKGRKRMAGFGDKVIMIHPGSGSPKKNWPVESYIALADRLQAETEWTPVFSLGEADDAIARELTAAACEIPVLPSCSLVELAECLSACSGYVGNDSGITHLAAAMGIPVLALFGPTDPRLWAPRGPNTHVLRAAQSTAESLAAIRVDEVLETMKRTLR